MMSDDLAAVPERFVYKGARRKYVAFPLGSIGTGSISLTGAGRLIDWSIRNRPDINQLNGYTHFAIKAEGGGKLLDARVLNGPYDGNPTGQPSTRKWDGYGWGANRDQMAGFPHFDDAVFIGRFPTAEIAFEDRTFPGRVRMSAFSPFVPHNDRDSSMPAAFFTFEVENTTNAPVSYTIGGTLGNYGSNSGVHEFVKRGGVGAIHLASAEPDLRPEQKGDLTIATDAAEIEHVDYHYRGQWFDSVSRYWSEFAVAGRLRERHYEKPRDSRNMFQQPEHATLAARIELKPGEKKQVRFVIAWNFAHGSVYWYSRRSPSAPFYEGQAPTWKNYYATQWSDSSATATDAFARWSRLEADTKAF